MTASLYELYYSYEKEELFKILLNPEDYQAQAVETAKRILKEKDWITEFEKVRTENEAQLRKEIEEKAGYYRKAVDFQEQKNSFQVRIADVPKLEGALIKNNIPFFREDKNVGVQLDSYPTQTYYFNDVDLKEVDRITKQIGLRAAAYVDPQPFFRFEIKVLIIVVIIVAIIFTLLI
jgi:hypothetical protein